MNDQECSAEFLSAGEEYRSLVGRGLGETDAAARALARMLDAAPRSFHDMLHAKAVEFGLFPKQPDGYTENGEPVYRLETIAERLGMTPDEATQSVADFKEETGADAVDPATVRRAQ